MHTGEWGEWPSGLRPHCSKNWKVPGSQLLWLEMALLSKKALHNTEKHS